MTTLTSPDEAILILGSLNAKPQDRTLERPAVRPVQVLADGGVRPVPFFDSWGELGVSSVAWHPGYPTLLYACTGTELVRIDLDSRDVTRIEVPNLWDVHEMTLIGDTLWLANTGSDEAIAFDLAEKRVSRRMSLSVDSSAAKFAVRSTEDENGEVEVVDKFHCNQIFDGFDGELYALVHHVSGKQLIRRIGRKLIKNQGNGGVVNLDTGQPVPLGLKGPHSVEKVGEEYWVCDSGRATLNVYDRTWTLRETLPTRGWGRGCSYAASLGLFYAGVSETRKRYLGMGMKVQRSPNMVRVFSAEKRTPLADVELSNIEQVNNVYVIPKYVAYALLELA